MNEVKLLARWETISTICIIAAGVATLIEGIEHVDFRRHRYLQRLAKYKLTKKRIVVWAWKITIAALVIGFIADRKAKSLADAQNKKLELATVEAQKKLEELRYKHNLVEANVEAVTTKSKEFEKVITPLRIKRPRNSTANLIEFQGTPFRLSSTQGQLPGEADLLGVKDMLKYAGWTNVSSYVHLEEQDLVGVYVRINPNSLDDAGINRLIRSARALQDEFYRHGYAVANLAGGPFKGAQSHWLKSPLTISTNAPAGGVLVTIGRRPLHERAIEMREYHQRAGAGTLNDVPP